MRPSHTISIVRLKCTGQSAVHRLKFITASRLNKQRVRQAVAASSKLGLRDNSQQSPLHKKKTVCFYTKAKLPIQVYLNYNQPIYMYHNEITDEQK